ncbi:hypothetical protein NE237_020167 [Protea cynaroides]|uniref:Thaumatin-like protein n=1 Tax=Protea cynaroides TaxID=273540 RepID=A0A9Q0K2C5_9MAGN|nr:hypothetical protein NE237_020167 [Protea cynaroides]
MKQLRQSAASSLLSLLIWLFMLSDYAESNPVTFIVVNNCPFTIWPATAPNTGNPVIPDDGFCLPPGEAKRIQAPPTWSGRLWARTGCDFTTKSNHACQTGDCQGRYACDGVIGTPPATLVEVSLQPIKSSFDVSLVDGYNLPVSVYANTKSVDEGNCYIGGCGKNINSCCPPELQVKDGRGTVVACKSACLAFNLDVFCCRNAYGSPGKCKANVYSKLFKDACPSYYSYAFDKPSSVSCSSKEYIITFCPSGWGDHILI